MPNEAPNLHITPRTTTTLHSTDKHSHALPRFTHSHSPTDTHCPTHSHNPTHFHSPTLSHSPLTPTVQGNTITLPKYYHHYLKAIGLCYYPTPQIFPPRHSDYSCILSNNYNSRYIMITLTTPKVSLNTRITTNTLTPTHPIPRFHKL